MSKTLHIHLAFEYFDEIKAGIKPFEYRLKNKHWSKKLIGRDYDVIHFYRGYPKKGDKESHITVPYRGYEIQKITHKHFGKKEVEVFAIYTQEA